MAPDLNKTTVSVDVKQHFNHLHTPLSTLFSPSLISLVLVSVDVTEESRLLSCFGFNIYVYLPPSSPHDCRLAACLSDCKLQMTRMVVLQDEVPPFLSFWLIAPWGRPGGQVVQPTHQHHHHDWHHQPVK